MNRVCKHCGKFKIFTYVRESHALFRIIVVSECSCWSFVHKFLVLCAEKKKLENKTFLVSCDIFSCY